MYNKAKLMHSNDDGKNDQFDASLHLPGETRGSNDSDDREAAAELIRRKVKAAYSDEPDAAEEIKEVEAEKPAQRSRHQQFIFELTNSGRPLHEIQTAWHEYYAGLPDAQKHEVWREFYSAHAAAAHHPAVTKTPLKPEPWPALTKKVQASVVRAKTIKPALKHRAAAVHRTAKRTGKQASPLHSLFFGLGVGSITILIFLFGFFNDRIIAPFIQPSRNATNIPLISGAAVGKDPEVIIPKINAEVPVVYDVNTTDDEAIQQGLTEGVVHYPTSPDPGQDGNVVIVGHSSGNIFNLGNYKFAFSLLRELDNGDTFFLQKDGKRYTYQVYKKEVVKPTDVGVLGPADKPDTATLITCDPPGLSTNRLVLTAEQISPDPAGNAPAPAENQTPSTASIIPGNSPSLWSRLVKWFKS